MRKNPELIDNENPEWTDETAKRAVTFDQLPPGVREAIRRGRGPQRTPTKISATIRYDAEVIEHFKADGPGWQTRMNAALKKAIHAGLA